MSASRAPRNGVRAAVPRVARDIIAARAPQAEIVEIDDLASLEAISFVVPIPYRMGELTDVMRELPDLRVVQTLSAGVDQLATTVPDWVTLCSARGARDSAVAEWVVGALLGANTHLLQAARAGRWGEREEIIDLAEARVLILGMGSIGEAVAARLAPFGTEVVPIASRARDGRHGVEELPGLLAEADALVVLTPLTEATRGLIDAAALARMKDGALLVNAGRGPVVDTEALLAETAGGRLRAVLDVTDPEPLPDDHPLWRAPGVLAITPHIGGHSARAHRQAAELAGDQLARVCAGEPLCNVVHQGQEPTP